MDSSPGPLPDSERPSTAMLDPGSVSDSVDDEEARRRGRVRFRWVVAGLGLGIVFALVVTAIRLAWSGWHILPYELVWNLLWAPYLGAIIGYNRCPVPRPAFGAWGRPQLGTRTLMVVVAYVALLFGAYLSTERLGRSAALFAGKAVSSVQQAKFYQDQVETLERDAERHLEAARKLRDGEVPATLPAPQWALFKSIEASAPEERKRRFAAVADGEERQGASLKQNASVYRRLAEYYVTLAAKYNRARRRPWRPVAPDPPMPGTR